MRGGESLKSLQQYVERWKSKRMTFIRVHSKTNLSPPLISFASLSSFPPGEAKAAAPQRVAKLATPTERGGSYWLVATNGVNSLSFAFAQQLPQRGSQGTSCQREAESLPYGCDGSQGGAEVFFHSSNFSSPKEGYI